MSCGVSHRYGLDLVLLWLWCRLAAAALIQPLAWELSYAAPMALKKKKKKRGRREEESNSSWGVLCSEKPSLHLRVCVCMCHGEYVPFLNVRKGVHRK